ncbi:MAG: tetratricopeptide repeat protein [Bryobacteraceae bacterium]
MSRSLLLSLLAASLMAGAQSPAGPARSDKAEAYYNFAMGHLYAELAGAYGNRAEYINKAIDYYRQAMRLDPSAAFLTTELTDLYIQAGRLRDAVTEAEAMLKQDAGNLEARRILGRIYTRMIGDTQHGKVDENMLRKAIEQYEKIVEKEPKDIDSWLVLGRLYKAAADSPKAEKAYQQALQIEPNNEEALTGLAIVYSDVGDTAKAIEKLKQLAGQNPNPRALAALASSYEQLREYRAAAEALRKAIQMQPDNTRLKRALAQDLLLSDDYEGALGIYTELAAADPRDAQVQLRLAEAYRQKRDFPKAHAALAKAREIDGNTLEVRYDEVNLLDAEGKPQEALALLKGIVEETAKTSYSVSERGNRAMLLERLGLLHRSLNQHQAAVDAFRQIAVLQPDSANRVAVHIVDTWRMARDYAKARQEADAALQKWPKDRMIQMVHASLLADMGETAKAASEVKALLNGERDRETWLALAQIYEKGKQYGEQAKALAEAEKLSTSKQDKATVYFMRGAMYEKMKDFDRSEAEFRKVLAEDPDNASAMNYLGYMLADRNVRLEEAQKLITRALELDPNNGAYLDSLAWVYYRQNKLPEAENLLIRALERVGNDPTVHDHLGDVYDKQGKTREAITQWQASLKEWEATPKSEADPDEIAKVAKKLENARVRLAKETGRE